MAAAPDTGASAELPGCAPWGAQPLEVWPADQEVIVALSEGAAPLPLLDEIGSALLAPTADGAPSPYREVSSSISYGPQAVSGSHAATAAAMLPVARPHPMQSLGPDAAVRALAADLQAVLPRLAANACAPAGLPVGRVVIGLRLGAGVLYWEPGLVVAVAARSSDAGAAVLKCVVDAIRSWLYMRPQAGSVGR
ncbi:hypothetical protein MNEG_12974 [Monoraphidium neglectum]|uniref:Uncharacterized protein n=1 Tax=Monoraphidium neglectum TaxID=145388 RepID=A0A0D2KGN7_9CHLO|nr:hypothetical protein MNEG_12974 [Monoraphidium neglectum]KIY94988.1 hypothetical protein MNEG_12974 [Monoraphidium neglectum]|eukprot:XP_013894008.1 hypothetical protein MNEG_12974 [Monoraphidium neglectum]